MLEDFETSRVETAPGVEIFVARAGSGPPLLMLHGFPQTHVCWHRVASELTRDFTVVLTDLRGYGASSKPPGGPNHVNYAKRAMGKDQIEVMNSLGFAKFSVVG